MNAIQSKVSNCDRISPVDGSITWTGDYTSPQEIDSAVIKAAEAFVSWSKTPLDYRCQIAHAFAQFLEHDQTEIAKTITLESGKPLWESKQEVQSAISKVANAIEAIRSRRWTTANGRNTSSMVRYKPLGPMLVLGPYNLPLHLPGAHIVPALLAGNTVLFKPSEKSPAVGEWIARAWNAAKLPKGVLSLLHGAVPQAQYAVSLPQVAGVLFTGSYSAGVQLHKQLAGRPECMLALEMGGNNPLVIDRVHDRKAAITTIIQSAYLTSGQRCTCARRLILIDHVENRGFLEQLSSSISRVQVGDALGDPQPFLGTLVSPQAAQAILDSQLTMVNQGAKILNESKVTGSNPAMLSPGLLQWDDQTGADEEHFGPLATVRLVHDMEEAIQVANQTKYGLAAGLLSDDPAMFSCFVEKINAGVINWNSPTTGASGSLPFGGIGASGNHRPSGFFASDYCSYPVASIEKQVLTTSDKISPGLERLFE